MTNLTRRNFLKQLALLPVAAALPALPKVKAVDPFFEQQVSLLEVIKSIDYSPSLALIEAGTRMTEGFAKGLNANIDDLLQTQWPIVSKLTEQVWESDWKSDIEGPAPSEEWWLGASDEQYWQAQEFETYWETSDE